MEENNKNDKDIYIEEKYLTTIAYYWNASKLNKRWYKITRSLTIILGALVTLVASLSSSTHFVGTPETIFAIATPFLAALLTIIAGFSQSFQWGSTWQNMVLTAQYLQKEYDEFLLTPVNKRNYITESEKLNNYIITESETFFERMLGGVKPKGQKNGSDENGNGDVNIGEKEKDKTPPKSE